jgi:hypothetical protein
MLPMSSFRSLACCSLLGIGLAASAVSRAGPYADDMAKCLVKSSTPADRTAFVQFIFIAIAQHPDTKNLAKVSPQQVDDSAKATGQLIERLMVESCRTETQAALRYEGAQTVFYAFQTFGQAAAAELFQNPQVAATFKQANKYMDADKLKSLMGQTAAPPASPAH